MTTARVSDIASAYTVRVTVTPVLASGWQRILIADPSRYHVRFDMITGIVTTQFISPTSSEILTTGPSFSNLPRTAKFSEEPGSVGAEWYIFASGGEVIVITENLQLP